MRESLNLLLATKGQQGKAKDKGSNLNLYCFICKRNNFARQYLKRAQFNSVSMEKSVGDTSYASLIGVLND